MEFESFLLLISKVKNIEPGGMASQFKMAPNERKVINRFSIKRRNPKKAAVLALFYPNKNNETCFSLILRPNYKGVHAKQISFPGGKFEKSDISLKTTALRETNEEIGIKTNDIQIEKQMTNTFISPSNFLVSPFVGFINYTPTFIYNHEVEKVIEVKLLDLLNEASETSKKHSTSYMNNVDVPYYKLNDYMVWGATAMMLSEIKDLLKSI
jgi:8-oxo-dGTP pyrophosphatase MutT (NUDIX family)